MFSIDRAAFMSRLMGALYVLTAFSRNHQLIMETWFYRQLVGSILKGGQIVACVCHQISCHFETDAFLQKIKF